MCIYTVASLAIRQLFLNLGLNMQRFSLLGRIVKIPVLGEKAVVRRNVFTLEGPGKGNGLPFITMGDNEQYEVMEWRIVM
jgi:hypothetical protein